MAFLVTSCPKLHQLHLPSTPTNKNRSAATKAFIVASTAQRNETKLNSFLAGTFKSMDSLICDFLDKKPLRPSVDPERVLSGNFAPVDELPPTPCTVEGCLPDCLDGGMYLLNGPSPQFAPRGPYHLFDGDGMIHAVRLMGGGATFCSRHVRTYKYRLEGRMGYPVIPSPFSAFNGVLASGARVGLSALRVLVGEFDPFANGYGTANTSLAVIGGKLYALGENDLPYEIKVTPNGDITTVGRHNFHGGEDFLSMTAHPKTDPESGETYAMRYHLSQPHLTLFKIDGVGRKQPDVPIFSVENTALMHDLAITENYIVVNDVQMILSPPEILKGKPPTKVDLEKTSRIGVIEKDAVDGSGMRWVDAPGFNTSHMVNAWEEDGGDTLVLVGTNITSVEHALEKMDSTRAAMEEIRISLTRKEVTERRRLSTRVLDMPAINRAYLGKKTRYAYASQVGTSMITDGVVKVDLSLSSSECVVASRMYGSGCIGNEPFFVPREPNNPEADEDDGFVVAFIHDSNVNESRFLVMDAKSPTLEIVVVVKLPGRVPSCFHGLFVSANELNNL